MLALEKKSQKPPMAIKININTPLGVEVEKIFDVIKKIDELRDDSHVIHLEIDCNAL